MVLLECFKGNWNFKCKDEISIYLKELLLANAFFLYYIDIEILKCGEQKGLETLLVHTLKYECFWKEV